MVPACSTLYKQILRGCVFTVLQLDAFSCPVLLEKLKKVENELVEAQSQIGTYNVSDWYVNDSDW